MNIKKRRKKEDSKLKKVYFFVKMDQQNGIKVASNEKNNTNDKVSEKFCKFNNF